MTHNQLKIELFLNWVGVNKGLFIGKNFWKIFWIMSDASLTYTIMHPKI